MKKLEIQKTSAAYTLRYDRPMRAMCLTTAVSIFLFGSIISAIPWLIYGAKPPVGMVFISIYVGICALVFPPILIRSSVGFRLIADEQGVHRCFFNRVQRTFLWRHIRSCGIEEIPPSLNEGRVILPSFYVSTEKVVENMKNCLFIRVDKEDEQAIRESGLLTFCRSQMDRADRKFR